MEPNIDIQSKKPQFVTAYGETYNLDDPYLQKQGICIKGSVISQKDILKSEKVDRNSSEEDSKKSEQNEIKGNQYNTNNKL